MYSSEPASWHDPRRELVREESLSLIALGETVDTDLDAHVKDCSDCHAELAALRRTVALGRDFGEYHSDLSPAPSPTVWQGIAAELDLPTDSGRTLARRQGGGGRPRPWWHWAVAAAAVVLIIAAGAGGYIAGRNDGPSESAVTATAQLKPMPGGPTGVLGNATVRNTPTGPQVSVQTANLPLRDGYYEVWLFNPTADRMVAIGTLPQHGAASFPVPPGLNVFAYHVVDISAQNYDGEPAHQQSVLRGTLTQ